MTASCRKKVCKYNAGMRRDARDKGRNKQGAGFDYQLVRTYCCLKKYVGMTLRRILFRFFNAMAKEWGR